MQLPDDYIKQMTGILGEAEASRFFASCEGARTFGLRLNPLKLGPEDPAAAEAARQFGLERVPWCGTGYYYRPDARPGRHPWHAAGMYYIQEPSAMSAAEALDAQPGETVLDLAAAPGGKTTQIAGAMRGEGLLVANEIHPARARVLSENVERMGIRNCVVTQAAPDALSERFPLFFDRIMLDAPCSGEGMFRKDPDAVAEWSPGHVALCARRQADILPHAARMLKPGGRLVYSTCTFNREENEWTVERFLDRHPDFELLGTERIWPHLQRGEGHFVAVLRKVGARETKAGRRPARGGRGAGKGTLAADMALFDAFAAEALPGFALGPGEPLRFGDALYWLPAEAGGRLSADALQGLRVPRPGLHLGDLRKGRIEPAHALALAAAAEDAAWVQSYRHDAPDTAAYLRGETLPAPEGAAGWGLVAVDGLPLGWGKASGGRIKNHLPKGLRWLSP